jgi:GNAT superfamily N-acetyltransferase
MNEHSPLEFSEQEQPPDYTVILIAGRRDLMAELAEMRYREWGKQQGKTEHDWWVQDANVDTERDRLPVGFVALDAQGQVIGGLSLRQVEHEELSDRGPWLEGVIVRADHRGQGIGRDILTAMEAWSMRHGITQLWVCNEGPAVGFYERCGWARVEDYVLRSGELVTILTKHLVSSATV